MTELIEENYQYNIHKLKSGAPYAGPYIKDSYMLVPKTRLQVYEIPFCQIFKTPFLESQ